MPPESVALEAPEESSHLQTSLTGVAGENITVKCVVKGGKPAPRIHWYLEDLEIEGNLESDSETVKSIIQIPVKKEDQQKTVRCVVDHEALTKEMEASIQLNVHCKN